MGQIPFDGTLKIAQNVQIGYFAQNQAQLLDGNITVFDTIDRVATGDMRTRVRDLLGAFMFGGEAIDKYVKVLSGGERSRLAMIQLLLQPVNLLILDEPTNHLDMQSKDVLKNAIREFDGTAIIVSHDRYFLKGLVDRTYVFKDQQVREPIEKSQPVMSGAATTIRPKGSDEETQKGQKTPADTPNDSKQSWQAAKAEAKAKARQEKMLKACEDKVTQLEQQIAEIEQTLTTKNDMQLVERYTKLQAELDAAMKEWEQLME
jgi:ATP-binding cassette subfamily F protein 3